MNASDRTVLVTGGSGYVGAILVPKLLDAGYNVRVLDLYLFGENVLSGCQDHPNLTQIKGDLRNPTVLNQSLEGCTDVIHLACVSNDPSFDLDPGLGKSINYEAFFPLVRLSKQHGVSRFIYASSSSVYGVKEDPNVMEDLPLEPLTDYSKYKALCEDVLEAERTLGFTALTLRPATVCGYSPRLRLDLTVNILTAHAYHKGEITVFGGAQRRPNIHIEDVTDLYVNSLSYDAARIDGKVYNAGHQNHRVSEIAEIVKGVVGEHVTITTTETDDHRSYHISSDKIKNELGFEPSHTIEDAVKDLVAAFNEGRVPNAQGDARYSNIRTMQALKLK
ncbi:MAG: UDP-glucose 4-epimerase [Gemmatimonadetes bacterium]|nr:UDP-glucose 4-epimerase [Gemmatimonadota bacterium]